ncbi:carboxypeptidase-like protein [Larkinella arboricola]|uniref:Carboxypeptidase-like protein n=1 Tax=Larkinella arboricola TaxID=643671 RepID=A0A327WTU3_LARAB|nr:carboxypeptidase-like regulatory domain-containing protein [Larkinella arboricola]RAJ96042.1 carboxypeptidase-like protein [Larkinella arboricola]
MKTLLIKIITVLALALGMMVAALQTARAQGQEKLIMFTGIITAGKTSEPLPEAYISIPRAGRGVLANTNGYFAIPVLPGDSIVFSYVGYKKQYHIIPRRLTETSYSAVVAMQEDVQMLTEVKVYPYPTEELFKQAFVNMKLPDEKERENMARNLSEESMQRLAAMTPMSAAGNYRYYLNQQWYGRESMTGRSQMTTIPFLNPFAWANFIKSVKNGDMKKKDFRQELNATPPEGISRQDILKNN